MLCLFNFGGVYCLVLSGRRNIFMIEEIYLFGPNQSIGNLKLFGKNLSLTNLSKQTYLRKLDRLNDVIQLVFSFNCVSYISVCLLGTIVL